MIFFLASSIPNLYKYNTWNLKLMPLCNMFLAIKAAPIVGSKLVLKVSMTNRYTNDDFPTPYFII